MRRSLPRKPSCSSFDDQNRRAAIIARATIKADDDYCRLEQVSRKARQHPECSTATASFAGSRSSEALTRATIASQCGPTTVEDGLKGQGCRGRPWRDQI